MRRAREDEIRKVEYPRERLLGMRIHQRWAAVKLNRYLVRNGGVGLGRGKDPRPPQL